MTQLACSTPLQFFSVLLRVLHRGLYNSPKVDMMGPQMCSSLPGVSVNVNATEASERAHNPAERKRERERERETHALAPPSKYLTKLKHVCVSLTSAVSFQWGT